MCRKRDKNHTTTLRFLSKKNPAPAATGTGSRSAPHSNRGCAMRRYHGKHPQCQPQKTRHSRVANKFHNPTNRALHTISRPCGQGCRQQLHPKQGVTRHTSTHNRPHLTTTNRCTWCQKWTKSLHLTSNIPALTSRTLKGVTTVIHRQKIQVVKLVLARACTRCDTPTTVAISHKNHVRHV